MPSKLEELIKTINKDDKNKVTCVIVDGSMGWAIRVTKKMGIRAASFWSASAATLATIMSFQKLIDDGIINDNVIYVAFGSYTIFDETQFEELAIGLELSNRPFLWVVRLGMTKEATTTYPDGYMERVGSRGKIVSWAPQQKVLAHPSIACFTSHCDWKEGVTNGLPFLCWPYFADQFYYETYICDTWKTGLGFKKDEAGIITRNEIKSKVEQFLSDKAFKTKALDIKEKVTTSVEKGGNSHNNLNNFI
ncbi:UDP-glycosyltransferase 83A1-like protein [Tanacetum coccineum]